MPSRPMLLALHTLQTIAFAGIGLGFWIFSGRSAANFVTFGASELLVGASLSIIFIAVAAGTFYGLPKVSEYLIRAQAHGLAFLESPLPFWAIVWISLGAGIGEEALFRGGVQTLAGDYLGAPMAIVLSAALFAIIHFAKPLIAAIIFAIGLVFGCIYWMTDSLLAVMIGHAFYDVFALWYVQKEMHRLGVFGPVLQHEN